MDISLQFKGERICYNKRVYDEELDCVLSILNDLCIFLERTDSVDFVVSGFGQDRWPVDVRTDLCTFLEQLPAAVAAIDAQSAFSIDFYEQGLERFISFEPSGDSYIAHCKSWGEWRPEPETERIHHPVLRKMLVEARDGLMRFLAQRAPQLAAHPWMREWAGAASS